MLKELFLFLFLSVFLQKDRWVVKYLSCLSVKYEVGASSDYLSLALRLEAANKELDWLCRKVRNT